MKFAGVEHNLRLMHRLSDQSSFAAIMEEARGETNWMRLRAYLSIFETYSIYLHQEQKQLMLSLLYEQLMHREGDIRRQAAPSWGTSWPASTPATPRRSPPPRAGPGSARPWTGGGVSSQDPLPGPQTAALPQALDQLHPQAGHSTLLPQRGRSRGLSGGVPQSLRSPEKLDDSTAFTLLDSATSLPLPLCSAQRMRNPLPRPLPPPLPAVRAAALELLEASAGAADPAPLRRPSALAVGTAEPCPDAERVCCAAGAPQDDAVGALEDEDISEIFLENLKAATPWLIKKFNIHILTAFARLARPPPAPHRHPPVQPSDGQRAGHRPPQRRSALLEWRPS